MSEEKKLTLWQKFKISIVDFEKYQDLALEKITKTILYIVILMLIFGLITAGIYTYKFTQIVGSVRNYIDENIETITFRDCKLNIIAKNHEKSTKIVNEELGLEIIIQTQTNSEEEINNSISEIKSYDNGILILNDKIVLKNSIENEARTYTYESIAKQYNINVVDKAEILKILSFDTIREFLAGLFIILFIYFFLIIYLPTTLVDIVVLSAFAYIISSITRLRLKYSALYNIAAYSVTLPIVLNIIYFIVNSFTGFTIQYFDVMYVTVATIYIVAAILLIRADVIKKQIELTRIIEEQDRVREELQRREEEQKQQEEKEKQKREEEKKRKEKEKKDNLGKEPEGDNA